MTKKVAFIGAGSMAEAMMAGFFHNEMIEPHHTIISNRSSDERLAFLQDKYGVVTTRDPQELLAHADFVFLTMKPKDAVSGLSPLIPYLHERHILVSVMAGVSTASIVDVIGKKIPVIRVMPNTSAAVGKSATGMAKGAYATSQHLDAVKELFQTIGTVAVVDDEEQLHAVTGLAGSGPAYIYYLVEAMEKAASEIGLNREDAKELILQTLIGSAQMLKNSPKAPETLRKEVTSPGGTTEAGLKELQKHQCQEAFIQCIKVATNRSKELGEVLRNQMLNQT